MITEVDVAELNKKYKDENSRSNFVGRSLPSSLLIPLIVKKNAHLRRSVQAMDRNTFSIQHKRYLEEKRQHFKQLKSRLSEIDSKIAFQNSIRDPYQNNSSFSNMILASKVLDKHKIK